MLCVLAAAICSTLHLEDLIERFSALRCRKPCIVHYTKLPKSLSMIMRRALDRHHIQVQDTLHCQSQRCIAVTPELGHANPWSTVPPPRECGWHIIASSAAHCSIQIAGPCCVGLVAHGAPWRCVMLNSLCRSFTWVRSSQVMGRYTAEPVAWPAGARAGGCVM